MGKRLNCLSSQWQLSKMVSIKIRWQRSSCLWRAAYRVKVSKGLGWGHEAPHQGSKQSKGVTEYSVRPQIVTKWQFIMTEPHLLFYPVLCAFLLSPRHRNEDEKVTFQSGKSISGPASCRSLISRLSWRWGAIQYNSLQSHYGQDCGDPEHSSIGTHTEHSA